MLTKIKIVFLSGLLLFFIGALIAPQANADTLDFYYDIVFSGMTPQGSDPYLTATFDDSWGGTDTVRLTMSTSGLYGSENVAEWYFNLDPMLNATNLSFTAVDVTASDPDNGLGNNGIFTNNPSDSGDNANFKADGDGVFDFLFNFPPPPGNGNSRFTAGETVVYDITYTGGTLSSSSFNFFSEDSISGGQGDFISAAHIQKIAGNNSNSGWVGVVPEPVSSTLFIIGGATLGFRRLRKNRKA